LGGQSYIKRVNIAFCLIAEKLSEISERLINSPHVANIEIPLPTAQERQEFIAASVGDYPAGKLGKMSIEGLAQNSAGLSLVNLNVLLSQGGSRSLDLAQFRKLKKGMIERQCQGLVEFVEPPHTLDLLVGQAAAKARLEQDAAWISQGRLETAPMGYLFCGAVGTGKTFFAECYAGSIGIPCLKLRNFRSKYVGETEGNLEQVLTVLRSLGPVVVIVDEADASLGDRRAEGDSGTSGRVFSMIASQMGDTRYRGQIIWMLLTCRPDLLPIDLKRQGRCEVHIPLFAPHESDEIRAMFTAMAKKNKMQLGKDAVPDVSPDRQLSGADLESILLAARRKALAANRGTVERGDLDSARGVHTFRARAGEGVAGVGGGARMHGAQLPASRLAGSRGGARRASASAGTARRPPPVDRRTVATNNRPTQANYGEQYPWLQADKAGSTTCRRLSSTSRCKNWRRLSTRSPMAGSTTPNCAPRSSDWPP
jgi:AAA+ superfamily predicted ATPase